MLTLLTFSSDLLEIVAENSRALILRCLIFLVRDGNHCVIYGDGEDIPNQPKIERNKNQYLALPVIDNKNEKVMEL